MSASDFLQDQLNLYRAEAGVVDSSPPPTESTERRKMEDAIALGISIFERILQRKHELVLNGEPSKLLAVLPEAADSLLTHWESWLVSTRPLVAAVDAWESAGIRLSRSPAACVKYTQSRGSRTLIGMA